MYQQPPSSMNAAAAPSGYYPQQGVTGDPYQQAGAYPDQGGYPPQLPIAAGAQWSNGGPQQQPHDVVGMQQQAPLPYPHAGGADPSQPVDQQQLMTGTGAPLPPQQQQQQSGAAGAAAPFSGFKRFFTRKPDANATPEQSPQQQQPGQSEQEQATAGSGTATSPERRGLLGLFGRSNTSSPQQQQQQQQQAAPPPNPAAPAADQQAQQPLLGPGAMQQSPGGVPVVPPPSGLCSRPPPSVDTVARLQASPLAPSRFEALNSLPARAASPPAPSFTTQTRGDPGLAVDPTYSGPPPLAEKYGPYLRFGGYDPATRVYSASVMMVIHQSRSPRPPHLKYSDAVHRHPEAVLKAPLRLWSYAGYNFWRWDLHLQLGPAPGLVEYHVVCSADHLFSLHPRYHFHLPAAGQEWHWGFYSCNGFHDFNDERAMGGIQPMWRDVMHVHRSNPLHVMFGGGDQLYCDDVWKVPSLVQWTNILDKPSRNAHPFSQNMVNETFDFYFRNYTTHFSKEVFKDALACIPQVMLWDDHDIFDGWGSYPPELQTCPVFAGIYFVARKFYLLFQCHATEDNYRQLNKGWGLSGLSWTRLLGGRTAVLGLDSRGERTREQVVRPASWAAFQDQVAKLPAGVRHVVVVATVPVIYPTVPGVEDAMMALAGTGLMANAMTAFLQKTGLSSHLYNQFGEPELLDDLLDHWSAASHEMEKYCFVRIMQDLAEARGLRFTLVCGDVHCAGVGCFQTLPKANLKYDHRYMVQVISSAIGNVPPPDGVIKALSASHKAKMLDAVTREKMRCIFENCTLLKSARNWCDVTHRATDGTLNFQLRVEHPLHREVHPATYDIPVPPLELPPGARYAPGPLPVAPPLPQPLMVKFQAELVAAGVGLEAAQPLVGVEGQPQVLHAGQQGPEQQQQAATAPPLPPQELQQQQQPPQDFGLQSDVQQHQQQQAQEQQAAALQQLQQLQLAEAAPPAAAAAVATGALPVLPPAFPTLSAQPPSHLAPLAPQQAPYEQAPPPATPFPPAAPAAAPLPAPAPTAPPPPATGPIPPPPPPPPSYPYSGVQQQQADYSYGAAAMPPPGGAAGPGYASYASAHWQQQQQQQQQAGYGMPGPPPQQAGYAMPGPQQQQPMMAPPPAHLPPVQYPPQYPASYAGPQYPVAGMGPPPGPGGYPGHPQMGAQAPYPPQAGPPPGNYMPPYGNGPAPYGGGAYANPYSGAPGY